MIVANREAKRKGGMSGLLRPKSLLFRTIRVTVNMARAMSVYFAHHCPCVIKNLIVWNAKYSESQFLKSSLSFLIT